MATRTVSLDWLFTARASAAPGAVLLAMVLGVGVVQPSFLSFYSLTVLMRESRPILLLALAQTGVVMLGGIDLSAAAVASFSTILLALLLPSLGVWGLIVVLLIATAVGAAQGYIHVAAQVSSFVVTLAGMGLWSGIALSIAHTTIPVDQGYAVVGWMEGSLLGVPVSFVFGVGVATLLWLAMRWTPFGRYVQAIGLGETAALLSGVPVGTVKIGAFAVSGLLAGLTGMALASAGGMKPRGSRSRRLLNQSTHSRVANSTASKLRHGPRRWMTSAL